MNTRKSIILGALAALLVTVSMAAAQEKWVGSEIMPRDGAELKIGNRVVSSDEVSLPVTVERVQGDWLWIGQGWLNKRYAVLLDDAEDYYTNYLRSDRTDPWAWNMRGIVRVEYYDFDGALRDYSEAIRLAPNNPVYYANRAETRYYDENYAGALSDLETAMRLKPNVAHYHDMYAMVLYDSLDDPTPEELDKVLEHYVTALRLDPSLTGIYGDRAYVYWDRGDLRRAADDFNAAIRHFPDELSYYRGRADLRWEMKDYLGALAEWEYVLKRAPASEPDYVDYNDLAWGLAACPDIALRNGPRAVEFAKKACELTEWKNGSTIQSLAAAYAQTGDFAAAVQWQTKAIELAGSEDADEKTELDRVLKLYQQNQPYRAQDNAPLASQT
jgi:tetratricopeptide (TPR) repeat protein